MSDSQQPWSIPEHWEWALLGDTTEVVGGGTPSTKDQSNFENGEIPWVTPADLSGYSEKYISHGQRNITEKGLAGSGARIMPAGAVLFSSRAPIGYVAIARNPIATNQGFKSFVPQADLLSEYLYYYLKRAKDLAVGLASGTTFPEISGKKAKQIPVPIPPVDEQRKIVAEIETQFARLDDAVAALQRARTRLKRYRASVLKAACEGRLVPTEAELARQDGREYEPASVLLERIKAERKAAPGKKRSSRTGSRTDTGSVPTNDLPELPEGWAWTTLDNLLREPLRNGHSAKVSPDGIGLPTISITAVTVGDFSSQNVKMTTADPNKVREIWLQSGDIYIQRSNTADLVGTARLYLGPEDFAIFPDLLIRVRLSSELDERFFESVLHSMRSRQYFKSKAQGISGSMPKISQETIERLSVPVPPKEEQRRISGEIDRVTSVIDQMEAAVEANLKRAESLRQSVLRLAFSGRLVAGEATS
jgi:type I restriction enzyme S subunit